MRRTYVLIDYENVQPEAMAAVDHQHFHVIIFVGANQAKVTYEVASTLQQMGDRAAYLKISGNGSNALDFHIAFHVGRLAEKEPDAYFHIVSKDTGFDPLIHHLKSQGIAASRVKSIADLPLVKNAVAKPVADRAAMVIANLAQRGASKPRTVKTLSSTINSLFQKTLSEAEIESLIAELTRKGILAVDQTRVSYSPEGL